MTFKCAREVSSEEVEKDLQDAHYISAKGGAPCTSIAKRAQTFSLAAIKVWGKISARSFSYLVTLPACQAVWNLQREFRVCMFCGKEENLSLTVTHMTVDIDLGLVNLPRRNG